MKIYWWLIGWFAVYLLSFSLNAQSNNEYIFKQCFANDGDDKVYQFLFPKNDLVNITSHPELYISDVAKIDSTWTVIDVSEEGESISGALKLPVHALKYKKYLKDQNIILVGNGRSYTRLQQEAIWLETHFSSTVKIYLGGKVLWAYSHGDLKKLNLQTLSVTEFFAESTHTRWHFIDNQHQLNELLKKKLDNYLNDRFIIVAEDLILPDLIITPELINAVFVLDGGINALEKFSREQGIILTAKIQRENNEECNNIE